MKYRKRVRYLGYRAVVTIYPAPAAGNHTPKGLARKETTPEEKKRQHQYQVWKLQGLILANFLPREDQFVTLTLPAGTTEEQARKARSGFLGACRRECSRQGKVLRYLCFLEKQGKWHLHLIMTGLPLETLQRLWKPWGRRVHCSPLDDSQGYFDLAQYLLEEEKPSRDPNAQDEARVNAKRPHKKHEKAWTSSHNLKEPKESCTELSELPRKSRRAPAGYSMVESSLQVWGTPWGPRIQYECIWVRGGTPRLHLRLQQKQARATAAPRRKTQRKKE